MSSSVRLIGVFAIGILLLTQISTTSDMSFLMLIIVVGIISSFIGTLAGGAGLITLPAMMMLGVPIHYSIATNKFSSGIASLSTLFVLIGAKEVKMKTIRLYVLFSIAGGMIGAYITSLIPEKGLNVVAICLLGFALVLSLQSKKLYSSSVNQEVTITKKGANRMSFLIAIYDGGFGPGSSTFSILYFLKSGYNYVKSTQMSRVFNFGSCFGAFIIFYQTGFLQWDYAIALATGSIVGTQLALKIVAKVPLQMAKWLMITILVLLLCQVGLPYIKSIV